MPRQASRASAHSGRWRGLAWALALAALGATAQTTPPRHDDAATAQASVNANIEEVSGEAIPEEVITASWENLTFTLDPIASSLEESKNDAVAVGLLEEVDLEGIYDLTLLNEVLAERGEEEITT